MKRWLCLLLALLTVLATAPVFGSAADALNGSVAIQINTLKKAELVDEDGTVATESGVVSGDAGNFVFDVTSGQTLYLRLDDTAKSALWDLSAGGLKTAHATSAQLADNTLFRMKVERGGAGAGLAYVSQAGECAFGGGTRGAWLKLEIAETYSSEDQKATADLTFTARKDGATWESGDYAVLRLTLWIGNHMVSGTDAEAELGEKLIYRPVSNEKNTMEWGNVAALAFVADSDAEDFFAKLSTRSDADIDNRYGKPADADLFFRSFLDSPSISSTSRASLTLYYPWRGQDDQPDPAACHIYLRDAEKNLSEITSLFTYLETDEDGYEVDGWRVKTRKLGSYVISDVPLVLDAPESSAVEPPRPAAPEPVHTFELNNNWKPIPNTGI